MQDNEPGGSREGRKSRDPFKRFKNPPPPERPEEITDFATPEKFPVPDPEIIYTNEDLRLQVARDLNLADKPVYIDRNNSIPPFKDFLFVDFSYNSDPYVPLIEEKLLDSLVVGIGLYFHPEKQGTAFNDYYNGYTDLLNVSLGLAKHIVKSQSDVHGVLGFADLIGNDRVISKGVDQADFHSFFSGTFSHNPKYPNLQSHDNERKKQYGLDQVTIRQGASEFQDIEFAFYGKDKPTQSLDMVVAELGKPMLAEYARMSQSDDLSDGEKERALMELKKGLRGIVNSYLFAHESTSQRVRLNNFPFSMNELTLAYVNTKKDEPRVVKTATVSGATEKRLDHVLGIEGLSLQEILDSKSKQRPVRIAAKLLEILNKNGSIDVELDANTKKDPIEISERFVRARRKLAVVLLDDLANLNYFFVKNANPQEYYDALVSVVGDSVPQEKLDHIKKQIFFRGEEHKVRFPSSSEQHEANMWVVEPARQEVTVGEVIHAPHIDWRISGNKMRTSGYYTTGTSSDFNNEAGVWNNERGRSHVLHVPHEAIDKSTPHIKLDRRIVVNPFKEMTTLKIPINDGSQLSTLVVTDENGEKAACSVFELQDGTVELQLDPRLVETTYVDISVFLTKAPNPAVYAVQRIPELNMAALTGSARELADTLAGSISLDNSVKALKRGINKKYEYSLKTTTDTDTHGDQEQYINQLASSSGIECARAATISALLLANAPDSDTFVNTATGYLYSGKSNVLMDVPKHAWLVSNTGKLYDPTPTRIAADGTKEQLKEWEVETQGKSGIEWGELLEKIKDVGRKLRKAKKDGVLPVIRIPLESTPTLTQENSSIGVVNLTKEDVNDAYAFFTELSWSQKPTFDSGTNTRVKSKDFEEIGETVNIKKLEEFLKDPNADAFRKIPASQKELYKQIAYSILLQ